MNTFRFDGPDDRNRRHGDWASWWGGRPHSWMWRPGRRMRRGALRFALLKLLAEGARHGYDLLREVRERGWGMPGPASVYPVLAMLEAAGLVRGRSEGDRRVYELTPEGREFLREHADRVDEILADLSRHSREGEKADEGRRALRESVERLMRAASQAELSGNREMQARVQEIADRARKEIYALLAEE